MFGFGLSEIFEIRIFIGISDGYCGIRTIRSLHLLNVYHLNLAALLALVFRLEHRLELESNIDSDNTEHYGHRGDNNWFGHQIRHDAAECSASDTQRKNHHSYGVVNQCREGLAFIIFFLWMSFFRIPDPPDEATHENCDVRQGDGVNHVELEDNPQERNQRACAAQAANIADQEPNRGPNETKPLEALKWNKILVGAHARAAHLPRLKAV